MRSATWAAIAVCLLSGRAAARDVFVDNVGGDDKNTGLHARGASDLTGPVRTIAKALRLAEAGDRVVLAKNEEPYHECVSMVGARHSGSAPMLPFILEGNGATLDGSSPIPQDGWTHYRDDIFCFRPPTLTQAVLFFQGRSISPLPLPRSTAFPPRLEPMQWCSLEGAIYFAVGRHYLPRDYKLSYAELPTGITLYRVRQVVIRNLTIKGYQADGVSAAAEARDVVLENVACTANGQRGVCVGGAAQVALDACKLFGNGQSQLMTCANSETHLLSCSLSDATAPGWVNQGGRVYSATKRIENGRIENGRIEDGMKEVK
jgi:hypothetical protein